MDFFKRHINMIVLGSVLLAQAIGLATQVRRPNDGGALLIRTWAIACITPLEKAFVHTQHGIQNAWSKYFYLRNVQKENDQLRSDLERIRLEQVRLREDAVQAHRIQTLLQFKEQYISKTVAAQVIGTSGSEQSRLIYIDRGINDGVKPNMAVITPDGVVGKVLRAQSGTAQVLVITDQTSGVGATLEKSRLQGILKGTVTGGVQMQYIMSDESVQAGDLVRTSGGDQIFPKGLPLGTVAQVAPGKDMFLNIRVKPAADLSRLEEVLVITQIDEHPYTGPDVSGPLRASDILAERLPSVPQKAAAVTDGETPATTPGTIANPGGTKPATPNATTAKPLTTTAKPAGVNPAAGVTTKPAAIAKPAGVTANKPAGATPATTKPVGTTTTNSVGTTTTKPVTTKTDVASPATTKPATAAKKPAAVSDSTAPRAQVN